MRDVTVRASAVLALLWATMAPGQELTTLSGTVRDGETGHPLPGAVVTVSSPALPEERSATADADGVYRLSLLPPGAYLLRVEAAGYQPWGAAAFRVRGEQELRKELTLVAVHSRADCTLIIWSQPARLAGEGGTQGTLLDATTLDRLPFLRPSRTGVRSWDDVASLAPGAVPDAFGHALAGAQSPEQRYLLDGVSVGDPLDGLNAGAALPLEFLDSVRVTTGGGDASFHSGAGQVAATLRGGSREFHGAVFGSYTPGLLSPAAPAAADPEVTQVLSRQLWNAAEVGAWLSGPIDPDRLWFFAGVSQGWNRTQLRQSLQLVGRGGYFGFPAEPIPGSERTRFEDGRSLGYAGALTFFPAPAQRLDLSVSGTVADQVLPTFRDLGSAVHTPDQVSTVSLRYAGAFLDGRLVVEATLGWFHRATGDQLPVDEARASLPLISLSSPALSLPSLEAVGPAAEAACQLAPSRCPAAGDGRYLIGGPGYLTTSVADRLSARVQATTFFAALGHHVLQAGAEVSQASVAQTGRLSGGERRFQRMTFSGEGAWQEEFLGALTGPDQVQRLAQLVNAGSSTAVGAFVQDRWAVLDQVTVELGLRYDTQALTDAAGQPALTLANQLSPRVGVSWDFTRHGLSRVYAHYGRYAGEFPLSPAVRHLPSPVLARFHPPECSLTSAGCPVLPLPGGSAYPGREVLEVSSRPLAVDPAVQPPSRDELVAGVEYELLTGLGVGVSYTRSWVNRVLEDVSLDDGQTYVLTNPGYGLGARAPAAVRDRDAVSVQLARAFADGWLARLDYTWSSLRGNWSGFYDAEAVASYLEPARYNQLSAGMTRAFDLPLVAANALGPLPGDVTHQLRAFVTREFELPHGVSLLVGLGYQGRSGAPLSYLGASPDDGPATVFLLARGAAGRLPWVHSVNLKLGAGYQLDAHLRVELTLDGLNVFDFAAVTQVDQSLTTESLLPVVGSTSPDPLCLADGLGCTPPVLWSRNFKRPWAAYGDSAYQAPMQWRLGVKLSF